MKRSPIKRGSKQLRRFTPIKQISDKRRRENRTVWPAVRAAMFERHGEVCYAADLVPEVECWHPAGVRLDPQHVAPRSVAPGLRLAVDNLVPVCRAHHRWIDAHPVDAHERGLHAWSWEHEEGAA
jgi:hypothetical protein